MKPVSQNDTNCSFSLFFWMVFGWMVYLICYCNKKCTSFDFFFFVSVSFGTIIKFNNQVCLFKFDYSSNLLIRKEYIFQLNTLKRNNNMRMLSNFRHYTKPCIFYDNDKQWVIVHVALIFVLSAVLLSATDRYDAQTWCICMMHRHDAQTWCTDMMHRHDAQAWCMDMLHIHDAHTWSTDMMHRLDAQTWCTYMIHRHDAQTWCTGMMHRHDAHTWCTGMMHRHDAQAWCTDMMHTHDAQAWCTDLMHRHGEQTCYTIMVRYHQKKKFSKCAQIFQSMAVLLYAVNNWFFKLIVILLKTVWNNYQ